MEILTILLTCDVTIRDNTWIELILYLITFVAAGIEVHLRKHKLPRRVEKLDRDRADLAWRNDSWQPTKLTQEITISSPSMNRQIHAYNLP